MTHHSTLLSRDVLPDEIDQDPKSTAPEGLKGLLWQFVAAAKRGEKMLAVGIMVTALSNEDYAAEIITGACRDILGEDLP